RSAIDTKHGAMGVFGRSDGVSAYGPRPTQAQAALYSRRIRWGGEPWYINHTFAHFNYKRRFFEPVKPEGNDKRKLAEYERHKRDFERVVPGMANKTGRHQFCYTTRAVIDQIVKDARDFFDGRLGENVDLTVRNLQGRSDTFFLVPFDVGGYCECEKCKPLLEVGRERGLGFNVGSASDYVFALVNTVAREVAKTHPDKYIGTLAYEGYYWTPASFQMEKNVQMCPCMHTKNWLNSPVTRANEEKYFREWAELARDGRMAPLAMWNYDFDVNGVMTAYYPAKRGEMVRYFLENGVRHAFFCGAPPMVEMYVTNQMYEDPDQDPHALVTEFFTKYFGPAAKPMQELYARLEEYSTNPRYRFLALQQTYVHDRIALHDSILTPERLALLRMDINRAIALGTEEPYAGRIRASGDALVGQYERSALKYFREKDARRRANEKRYDSLAAGYIGTTSAYPAFHWIANRKPWQIVDGSNMIERNPGLVVDETANARPHTAAGETFTFKAVKARHVRLSGIRHLCEIEVFTPDGREVARGKPVTSSGFPAGRADTNINDGRRGKDSAWWAEPPYRAEIDLGSAHDVNRIWIQPWWDEGANGRAYKYTIEVSADGSGWNQLGTRGAKLDARKGGLLWSRQEAEGAWIVFDLGGVHELNEMRVWNYNDRDGNTRYGMKDIEIASAANPEELFEQKWIPLTRRTLKQATRNGRAGADDVIDVGGRRVRYVSIHTLGGAYHDANGVGNWNVDAKDDRSAQFKVGIGQVRFYGRPLQLPAPEISFVGQRIGLKVPGVDDAEIRYSIDDTLPTRDSPLYAGPIEIDSDIVIRTKAFSDRMMASGSTMHGIRYRELLDPLEIARGKPTKAAGGEHSPKRAVKHINDGREGKTSAWWAEPPYSAEIDLGEEHEIDTIWLQPWWDDGANGRAYKYTIEASTDAKSWRVIIDESGNTTPHTEEGELRTFAPVTARHIRIGGLRHLCEIKVYRTRK
ncbi:MAG: DUF4838 domain-containing protein, partial [Planctomycetota bacterium]